jgi:AraC family transcriptional regulator
MLRSIQTLRDTSADARILTADSDQLALVGGGDEYYMPWHWHDGLMIMLPRVGSVNFRDETRRNGTWLSQDRFVVVPKTVAHQTAARHTNHDHLALYATDQQLAGMEARLGSLNRLRARLRVPTFFAISPKMRSLIGLCQASEPFDFATQSARGHLVAALLINCLSEIERGEQLSASTPGTHGDALVSEVKSHILNNIASDLSLDLIADEFGLSRRHVTRLFRDKTGMTIGEFQEQERVVRARELLNTTDVPIGEIAWRVGLESGSALARMMRRVAGITPSAARAMARSDKH